MSDDDWSLRRVLLASGNPHKVAEIQAVLGPAWHVVPFAPSVAETGSSFEENALQKATALRDVTGELCIADDSGIEIDFLGGRPGVYSSRWTNEEDWIPKVLREMQGILMPGRRCRYVCAAAVAYADGTESVVRGEVEGYVAEAPRGQSGFGYDPIMIPSEGDGRTFGEMEEAVKNGISHRGRAFQMLEQLLRLNAWQAVEEEDPATAELPTVDGYERVPDAYNFQVAVATDEGEQDGQASDGRQAVPAQDAQASDGQQGEDAQAQDAQAYDGQQGEDGQGYAAEGDAAQGYAAQGYAAQGADADEVEQVAEPVDDGGDADAVAPFEDEAEPEPVRVASQGDQTGGGGPADVGGGYPEGPGAAGPASWPPGGDQPGGGPAGGAGGPAGGTGGPGGAQATEPGAGSQEPDPGQPAGPGPG